MKLNDAAFRNAVAKAITAAKRAREEAFEKELRAYMVSHVHQFGGVCNLLTMLTTICKQQEANTDNENWGRAAQEFRRLERVLDLDYAEEA